MGLVVIREGENDVTGQAADNQQTRQQQDTSSRDDMSGNPTPQKMKTIDKRPDARKRKRASTIDLEDDNHDDVKNSHNPGSALKSLPPSPSSYLQHKPKGEIIFNKNDQTADLVLSKQNLDDVNFYAPHPGKADRSFVGQIEPTDEMLTALARTIKGEVGIPDGTTRIVFRFSVVDLDHPAQMGSPDVGSRSTSLNHGSSKYGALSFLFPPSGNTKTEPGRAPQSGFRSTGIAHALSNPRTIDSSPLSNLIPVSDSHRGGLFQPLSVRGLAPQRSSP